MVVFNNLKNLRKKKAQLFTPKITYYVIVNN